MKLWSLVLEGNLQAYETIHICLMSTTHVCCTFSSIWILLGVYVFLSPALPFCIYTTGAWRMIPMALSWVFLHRAVLREDGVSSEFTKNTWWSPVTVGVQESPVTHYSLIRREVSLALSEAFNSVSAVLTGTGWFSQIPCSMQSKLHVDRPVFSF